MRQEGCYHSFKTSLQTKKKKNKEEEEEQYRCSTTLSCNLL